MAINVLAVVATFSAFITAMQSQAKTGQRDLRLVGIASVAGIRGLPVQKLIVHLKQL
jgi:NAD(P)-dependent dehydrogenase (short-subunit alcohol dehydrogenase family)